MRLAWKRLLPAGCLLCAVAAANAQQTYDLVITNGRVIVGIVHVFVNGTAVVRDAVLVAGVAPGQAVRR